MATSRVEPSLLSNVATVENESARSKNGVRGRGANDPSELDARNHQGLEMPHFQPSVGSHVAVQHSGSFCRPSQNPSSSACAHHPMVNVPSATSEMEIKGTRTLKGSQRAAGETRNSHVTTLTQESARTFEFGHSLQPPSRTRRVSSKSCPRYSQRFFGPRGVRRLTQRRLIPSCIPLLPFTKLRLSTYFPKLLGSFNSGEYLLSYPVVGLTTSTRRWIPSSDRSNSASYT